MCPHSAAGGISTCQKTLVQLSPTLSYDHQLTFTLVISKLEELSCRCANAADFIVILLFYELSGVNSMW